MKIFINIIILIIIKSNNNTYFNYINQIFCLNNNNNSCKDDKNLNINNINQFLTNFNQNVIIKQNNYSIYITNISNENYNNSFYIKNNISYINFNNSLEKLKEFYNLSDLIIFNLDYENNNNKFKISKKFSYKIYNKKNGIKINLNILQKSNVIISSPINENFLKYIDIEKVNYLYKKGYDIFNINDEFYTSYCSKFTSPYKTDLILNDRYNEYYNKNIII